MNGFKEFIEERKMRLTVTIIMILTMTASFNISEWFALLVPIELVVLYIVALGEI